MAGAKPEPGANLIGQDGQRPSLSIAMIVRDEGEHLPECLAGIADIADEICVVDTGSSDDTVAIAQDYGCRLGHFAWRNDFAAARNASLELCTGDWIFVLDADERIGEGDGARLRGLTECRGDMGYRFITRNYTNNSGIGEFTACPPNTPLSRGFLGWYPSGKVRLFPNVSALRFVGKVHELVNQSLLALGFEIQTCDVPIHHYPLTKSPERVRQKQALYLELGLQKVREHPDDPRAAGELGTQYAEMGDYAKAVAAYREALRLDPSNPLRLKDLGGVLHLMGRSLEEEKALSLAVKMDAGLADAWRNLGVIAGDAGNWAQALACFERLTALAPENAEAFHYRAVSLERLGRLDEAAAMARQSVYQNPAFMDSLHNYVNLMRELGRSTEARRFLEELAASGRAESGIVDQI